MDVSVELHCNACGSANYSLPAGSGNDALISCNDCGRRMGNVTELLDEMLAQVRAHSTEALRQDLGRLDRRED